MTTETLTPQEKHKIPESFVELADIVVDNPDDQIVNEVLEDWRENPGEHIKNQVEELSKLYIDRSDREMYHWSNSMEEVTTWGTRDHEENEIEEIYHVFDRFSAKTKQWKSRSYAVSNLDEKGMTTIVVDPSMDVQAYRHDNDNDKYELLYGDEKDTALVEFFNRSLVSTVKDRTRDDEARAIANEDAKQKIEQILYDGPKVRTPME